MNANIKSNIAIILSVVAILLSTFGGGLQKGNQATGPDAYMKSVAREAGIGSRAYDRCLADETMKGFVDDDIAEAENIARLAELAGLGTPLNLVMTDEQVIIVNGAYPYEFFKIMMNEIDMEGKVSEEILAQFEVMEVTPLLRDVVRGFDPSVDHYRGSENPEVLLIEYSDFECPYCARIHTTLSQIVQEHDNFTWVYRHLPLNFHPQAFPAAIASECVAENEGNNAFWNFADTIFENQDKLQ